MTNDSNDSTTFDIEKFKEDMNNLAKFDSQPHVCPNCGHCPTCGRRDIMPRRLLPREYRPDPYFERDTTIWKWQQSDIVMCIN